MPHQTPQEPGSSIMPQHTSRPHPNDLGPLTPLTLLMLLLLPLLPLLLLLLL